MLGTIYHGTRHCIASPQTGTLQVHAFETSNLINAVNNDHQFNKITFLLHESWSLCSYHNICPYNSKAASVKAPSEYLLTNCPTFT
jgi:hypothetical protein